jgi:tol-pal system protein YbgF
MKMKRYFRNGLIALVAMTLVGVSSDINDARAQDQNIEGLVTKLNRLERDIQTLNRQVYKGGTPPKSSASTAKSTAVQSVGAGGNKAYIIRLEERLTQLETELQNTTNTIESMNHNVDQMKSRLDKLVSDIDFRLTRLESGARPQAGQLGGQPRQFQRPVGPPTVSSVPRAAGVQQIGPTTGGPVFSSSSGKPATLGNISETDLSSVQRDAKNIGQSATTQPHQAAVPKSILPAGTPTVQYRHAFSILRKTDYDQAELAFKEFIQKHPKDKLTPNARYWLGKTFYVRANYRDAAAAFLRAYQQAPNGAKAPNTLLTLGMSLSNLKKKSDACATFDKLAKDYPDASANIKKQLKRERVRTGCK